MQNWLILVSISLVIAMVGFKKFIWFVSIGYAFSVTGMIAGMALLFFGSLTVPVTLMMVIAAVYSLRLGLFLTIRESRGGTYAKVLAEATSGVRKVPLFVSVLVWMVISLHFFAQVSPLFFRLQNGLAKKDEGILIAGIVIMGAGLALQAISDAQKTAAKKRRPDRFCDGGFFGFVRCPNYLGELLVWTGMLAGSVTCLVGAAQWIIGVAGYVCIFFIMFNGARRLEKRQFAAYGNDPEYLAYAARVPILLPFIPLYSLKGWRFLG